MSDYFAPYIGTSKQEQDQMLTEMGKSSIMDLFSDIPQELLLDNPVDIPGPFSETELDRLFCRISKRSRSSLGLASFLGGGVRQTYIPAAIEELMRRGELYTAYTPYQPEISQGMLQILYEYQTMVGEILDMDVVNASMYDWATAVGEVILVMNRLVKKNKIILAGPIAPNRLEVAQSYAAETGQEIVRMEGDNVPMEELIALFKDEAAKPKSERLYAGVYFEVPTYYGTLPEYPQLLCDAVHEAGGLVAVGVDMIAMGLLVPPGSFGADLVVGEGQLLGNAPATGGPLLGILAAKQDRKIIRQMPGRLIGQTVELRSDRPGYCITLQTREQHIRREKATSNICTNESITAVNAAMYMASLGKDGLIELAQGLVDRAHYLAAELDKIEGVTAPLYAPFVCEFVVDFGSISHEKLEEVCIDKGFVPGKKIEGEGCRRLLAVSDLHSKSGMDRFVSVIKEVI